MKKTNFNSARLTLWANRMIAGILLLLVFTLPMLLEWYCHVRYLSADERWAIMCAFYCCALVTSAALWNMDRLLGNILEQRVFVKENVRRIYALQWCCAGVSAICLPAALIYYPLVFITVIMAFLCLVVSVVRQTMAAAVTIREENDLTI